MDIFSESTIRLSRVRLNDAAKLLSRAFWGDPFCAYLFPEEETRSVLSQKFYLLNLQHIMMVGEVHTTSSFKGIAAWRIFGAGSMKKVELESDPRSKLSTIMGEFAYARLMAANKMLNESHKRIMSMPHCYLLFLGVEPGHQGKGYGSILIDPLLKYADDKCLPCYLETMREENLLFYDKCGFRVVQAKELTDEGPFAWFLMRKPVK